MPVSATISVGGVPGTDDDVPINTPILLGNVDNTGVVAWLWAIVSQPDGPADSLSSTVIAAPQFTPKKEGTYLLSLRVTDASANHASDQIAVAVRQLKTRVRVPAQHETTEVSSTDGWHLAVAAQLQALDDARSDPGIMVGVIGVGGLVVNEVCLVALTATLKSGLPGEETIASLVNAPATALANVRGALAVIIGAVDGGALSIGKLAFFRWQGLIEGFAGAPSTGDPVFVSDAALLSLTAGTFRRQVGTVARVGGGTYDVFIHAGTGGVDITGAPFLLDGAVPATLPAAKNIAQLAMALLFGVTDAVDNATTIALELRHALTGGAPGANNVGTGVIFRAPNDAGSDLAIAEVGVAMTNVTALAEDASFVVRLISGGAIVARMTLDSLGRLTIGTPTSGAHATTKAYVDAIAQGLDNKASTKYATTAALPAHTYDGTPKTITFNAVGVWAPDGTNILLNESVLVKNEAGATRTEHGAYTCTVEPTAGAAGVFTRRSDMDATAELTVGAYTFIEAGAAGPTGNLNKGFVCIQAGTLDTDINLWTQFSGAGQITAGAGLTKTGDQLDVVANPDGSIVVNADDVQVGVLATDAQHGNLGAGALHANAGGATAGFMSAADFTKLGHVGPTFSGSLQTADVLTHDTTFDTMTTDNTCRAYDLTVSAVRNDGVKGVSAKIQCAVRRSLGVSLIVGATVISLVFDDANWTVAIVLLGDAVQLRVQDTTAGPETVDWHWRGSYTESP